MFQEKIGKEKTCLEKGLSQFWPKVTRIFIRKIILKNQFKKRKVRKIKCLVFKDAMPIKMSMSECVLYVYLYQLRPFCH